MRPVFDIQMLPFGQSKEEMPLGFAYSWSQLMIGSVYLTLAEQTAFCFLRGNRCGISRSGAGLVAKLPIS